MQRLSDLRNFKIFRRAGVNLTKQAVIDNWVSKGVLDDSNVKLLFEKYKGGASFLDKDEFIAYLKNEKLWFDSIFNSNF